MLAGEQQGMPVNRSLQSQSSNATPSGSLANSSARYTFGINAITPPPTNPETIMQRADEVTTIQRMMSDAHTSAVMLTGSPGAGKSTLAALLFHRMQLAQQAGLPAPRHMIWLSLGTYTTLPDMIAAILSGVDMSDPGFFLLKPEQQISSLLRALRRPQTSALVVLDQFEALLHPEQNQGTAGRGALPLFLEMLQNDLGNSRILLTSYHSPFDENMEESRVRPCLVTRISIPEGIALLQQRGVQGSPEDLSLIWQRCTGHVMALVLFSALVNICGISPSYLLDAPDFRPMWSDDVTLHLITAIYHYLNPIQYALVRALSLFFEPVPLEGIITAITGNTSNPAKVENFATFERELNVLVHYSLVQKSANAEDVPCYTIHQLLKQYIQEHYLNENDKRQERLANLGVPSPINTVPEGPEALQVALAAGHMQVAVYYQHLARNTCPPKKQRQGPQDVVALVSAIRHLCFGWRWQRACDLLFTEDLHESLVQWGAWNTLIGIYTAMLPPFGTLNKRDEGLLYGYVGMLYGRLGEQQQSQTYFGQALATLKQIGDIRGQATTLVNKGELLRIRGEYEPAREQFEQALTLLQQRPDTSLQSISLHNLGLLYHAQKDYQQAFQYYQESLKLAQQLSGHHKGMILTNLGMLLYEQQQYREGLALLLAALKLRQMLQDSSAIMLELFLRALEQKLGQEAYGRMYQEALEIQPQVFAHYVPVDVR